MLFTGRSLSAQQSGKYYYSKSVNGTFEEVTQKVKSELKKEGFGILTEVDVKTTLKEKLDVDLYNYLILGACNPPFAYKALQAEDKIGTMLPCNVIVQEREPGKIEVSAVDPVASMQAIENPDLKDIAEEVRKKLRKVIDQLN
ncbi:MAG: DUF302 domain-containing protein [Cytophagales bacterium]